MLVRYQFFLYFLTGPLLSDIFYGLFLGVHVKYIPWLCKTFHLKYQIRLLIELAWFNRQCQSESKRRLAVVRWLDNTHKREFLHQFQIKKSYLWLQIQMASYYSQIYTYLDIWFEIQSSSYTSLCRTSIHLRFMDSSYVGGKQKPGIIVPNRCGVVVSRSKLPCAQGGMFFLEADSSSVESSLFWPICPSVLLGVQGLLPPHGGVLYSLLAERRGKWRRHQAPKQDTHGKELVEYKICVMLISSIFN